MSFDLTSVLAAKTAMRRDLAARPIAEKLRMLDALRERTIALRGASTPPGRANRVAEETPVCGRRRG